MSIMLGACIVFLSCAAVQAQDEASPTVQDQDITPTPVQNRSRPVQIALFTPIQILPETDNVEGFRFNLIYGRNISVTGFDIGFVNHMTGGYNEGVQIGFVNMVDTDFTGWQSGYLNITKGEFEGFQFGMFNYAKQMRGVQFGLINYVGNIEGLQIGLVNINQDGSDYPVFPIVHWSF